MKKIILLFLIIFTNNAFSQTYGDTSQGKFDIMADLSNHNKIEEAKKIADDLLSGTYGKLSGYAKFFTLYVVADYYYIKDDYQKAYDFYQQFLDFDKNENPKNLNNKKIYNKKIYIDEAKAKLQELKLRLSLVSTNTSNNNELTDFTKDESNKTSETNSLNRNIASENLTIQADKKETNTDKTVTLTVSGTGKTIEEAKTNALRSAIERAFGAFISSKTEILNDNLVKDEIVSVANGNVQKYDIVSQVEIPNNGYAMTLNATVSISKLTSFAESKGIVVEFKGGLFAANMILQKLNEDAELIAIKNLTKVSFELLNKSFDYELVVSEPKLVQNTNEIYAVTFNIKTIENSNYNNFKSYFINTIQNLNINTNEYENITKSGKKVGYLYMDYKLYRLRNKKSSDALIAFFTTSQLLLKNFKISTGLDNLNIKKRKLFFQTPEKINTANLGMPFFEINNENTLLKASIMNQDLNKHYQSYNERLLKELENINISEEDIKNKINHYKSSKELIAPYCYYKLDDEKINFENCMAYFNKLPFSSSQQLEWLSDMIIFNSSFNSPEINYEHTFSISELQKINSFKIEKLPIN